MPLNAKQELFVREYLVDMSPADAYVRAGYEVASREVAWKAANRLMKNVEVLRAIDEAQCARLQRLDLDADWAIARFHKEYLEASRDRNHSATIKALENIGKFLGLYERDNTQKARSPEEVARVKAQLEMMGVDFSRKNFPPELVGVPSGGKPKVLPGSLPDDAVIDDNASRDGPDEPSEPSYPHHTVASTAWTR